MKKERSKAITVLASLEWGIGLVGLLYFVFRGLTQPDLSSEMRVIKIVFGSFYSVLIFSGLAMLYLKPISRKLTLFLSPFYALLVSNLYHKVFVLDCLFGVKFANLLEKSGGVIFMSTFLFLIIFLNNRFVKEQFK